MGIPNNGRRSIYDHYSDHRFFLVGPSAYDEEGVSNDLHNLKKALT